MFQHMCNEFHMPV